ncbi:hypothetical protein L6R50_00240 [Myxococcota bacterium]|nr:hypothetical protein [Myxococcota bacterium]
MTLVQEPKPMAGGGPRSTRGAVTAGLLGLLAAVLAPGHAGADGVGTEEWFGPTRVGAQAGNGGLTVGIAATGELTVLGWPSPSYADQLDYLTALTPDARDLPYFGARPNQGAFAGLAIWTSEGFAGTSWTRDAPWETSQSYRSQDGGVVLTRSVREDLGLVVEQSDGVLPDADVLVRRFEVRRSEGSPVVAVRLLHYANFAPTLDHTERYPTDDWLDDGLNDFGLVWDPSAEAFLAFRPEGEDPDVSLLDPLVGPAFSTPEEQADAVAAAWEGVADAVGGGVWIALGGASAPDQVQAGADADQGCRWTTEWGTRPEDAFADAADGELSGWIAAGCQANGAMGWFHSFGASGGDAAVFDVLLAAAGDRDAALAALDGARDREAGELLDEVDAHWGGVVAGARLPAATPEVLAFAQRWLVSVLQGTDRSSAIVAAITTQPPYRQDWPRDATFIDLALDIAGFEEEVTRHKLWLSSLQARQDIVDEVGNVTPRGAWAMNYYADGRIGGPIPFEIDQTALYTWGLWDHGKRIPSAARRREYLLAVDDAVILAADLLSTCVEDDYPYPPASGQDVGATLRGLVEGGADPGEEEARSQALAAGEWERFLPCFANEDDDPAQTRSLYGAHTVRAGLLAAAAMLEDMGQAPARVAWYRERAEELAQALAGMYWDEASGGWEGRADWMLWPHPPLPLDDPRMTALAGALLAEAQDDLSLRTEGGSYVQKKVLTLARAWAAEEDRRAQDLAPLVDVLVRDLPTEGTLHVGEVWCSLDTDGDGAYDAFDNRVAVPHLWTASLIALGAWAVHEPEVFDAYEGDSGWWDAGEGGTVSIVRESVGCGCASGGPSPHGAAVGALVLLGGIAGRRGRRS